MSANPTPDATATPRTDEAEFFMSTSDKQSPDEGCMMVEAYFARTLERELSSAQAALTAAKAEIAGLNENLDRLTCVSVDAQSRAERAEAQLRERVAELEADKARLVEVAHDAVSFVGAANYRERQDEAREMIGAARAGKGAT